jgi:hypothetical protein
MPEQKIVVATIAVAAISAVMVALVSSLLVTNTTLHNNGNVKSIGVDVYWDQACTNKTSSMDWGTLEPNVTRNVNVYIKNSGTAGAKLSMTTSSWNPTAASNYISLSWNCTNYVLQQGQIVGARLTLSVSSAISGISTFSFDITITGTES